MTQPHILVVTFPGQGHINPGLQFAKRLATLGLKVTFAITISAFKRMSKLESHNGLSFETFSDGHDDGSNLTGGNFSYCLSELNNNGPKSFAAIIRKCEKNGCPVTCVVYSVLVSWAAKVAREFNLRAIYLWNQPAAVFDIYYYYFYGGYDNVIDSSKNCSTISVKLPGLPLLKNSDLPSFFTPKADPKLHGFALPALIEDFQTIDQEINPRILVNTFDDLEYEALKSIKKYRLAGVGPLIPSAFLDGKDPSDTSFGADIYQGSHSYTEFLNSKPKSSVIYISFGSISNLSETQMEETARALLDMNRPFLWVVRENVYVGSKRKELERKGLMVKWCCQVEVLSHPSVGCYVTHCGWNSTLESLVTGVPVVALPQWSDQGTNAKLVSEVWKNGAKMEPNEGVFNGEEIKKCVEMVMGGTNEGKELRNNAKKWKNLAIDAVKDGGSSDKNLKDFLGEIIGENW